MKEQNCKPSSFIVASLNSCLESASAIIVIVNGMQHQESNLPVWWLSIYYSTLKLLLVVPSLIVLAFNSALLVFALMLVDMRHSLSLRSLLGQSLFDILQLAHDTIRSIKGSCYLKARCQKILQSLLQVASTVRSGQGLQFETTTRQPAGVDVLDLNTIPMRTRADDKVSTLTHYPTDWLRTWTLAKTLFCCRHSTEMNGSHSSSGSSSWSPTRLQHELRIGPRTSTAATLDSAAASLPQTKSFQ